MAGALRNGAGSREIPRSTNCSVASKVANPMIRIDNRTMAERVFGPLTR
jgi:hypothetical protein